MIKWKEKVNEQTNLSLLVKRDDPLYWPIPKSTGGGTTCAGALASPRFWAWRAFLRLFCSFLEHWASGGALSGNFWPANGLAQLTPGRLESRNMAAKVDPKNHHRIFDQIRGFYHSKWFQNVNLELRTALNTLTKNFSLLLFSMPWFDRKFQSF